ncbi:MAG: hypothetical protein E6H47_02160 [Betaproteobacteria bacterium]|nr:MAG: hypothetical protein E6H47_02160 [Betaproteobacteria bacterium]
MIGAFGRLAAFDELLGVTKGVGIALQGGRCPSEVNDELIQDIPRVCTGWHLSIGGAAQIEQACP